MKKKFLPIILAGSMVFSSCSKLLDVKSHSAVATNTLSPDDVESFLNGIYNRVQNAPGAESYIMFDITGGNLINSGSTTDGGLNTFISNIMRPEQGLMSSAWNGYYNALYQINNLLESASQLPESNRKNEVLGIVHFFRAYEYYNLVTRWGGVPVLEKNTANKVPRNTEAEVWAFIEKELQAAISTTPTYTNGSYNYVSGMAAKALMARVMLAQNKKTEAAAYAEEVIKSGFFQLDSFDKIFRALANTEIIFSFKNATIESSTNISTLFYTYAHPVKGSYVYRPTNEVMNLFTATDTRRAMSVDTYQGLNVVNKYPSGQSGTDPLIVVRIAEMYLISAEAQGLAGLSRLNQLRVARGLTEIQPTTEEDYLNTVLTERRKEFVGEGFRWYDLVRLNRTSDLGLAERESKFPIPMNEIALNNLLQQNPKY
ncbi:RagB/SusD family nutrient uptake outer membrane protein [Chitinophaga sp. sic0106]|uniref:RagB/SusD family nutrient uptake outer membrane protein n=1 Tax=Chitinophaga sp. sic0106 TaxID=2854785 RepID=UPI001C439C59|nr:RagB/SusD family nutrient uptake outer membrane protein [Chitinophaga sp. sic0106]MBV7533957.1 RagB/SusD family nutrient uptake outer membrane protein [Chitinophaga sp. sic0106]